SAAYLCLMHMQGQPRTMQAEPRYADVAAEVAAYLEERLALAVAEGIPEERICLDPGIGFGKTVAHNLELVRRLDVLVALGRPVLVGFSRKSSLRRLTEPDDLLAASVAAAVAAFERGATILRVHDVKPTVDALTVAGAIAGSPCPCTTAGSSLTTALAPRSGSRASASSSTSSWTSANVAPTTTSRRPST